MTRADNAMLTGILSFTAGSAAIVIVVLGALKLARRARARADGDGTERLVNEPGDEYDMRAAADAIYQTLVQEETRFGGVREPENEDGWRA